MADLPTPQSYEQILSDMLSSYAAKIGIDDFNTGSAITSFFEVVALVAARSSGDLFQILKDYSVDRATGDALKRLAAEYNVTPISAIPTTGAVNVIDNSFTKISSQVYFGTNPPNIGSTAINIGDASKFTAPGAIYIGRGTPNVEGPLPYTAAPVQNGNYWTITLTSPTTKYHNLGETVILAQGGNRSVNANVIVISPGVGASPNIQYGVTTSAIILDGETEVDGVQVGALTPGSAGNVPAGAVNSFASPPFPGATVSNPLPFTNGADNETDDQLRVRVKNALSSIGLGTATAVKAALIGATAPDQQATIVSDSIQTNVDGSATVYIDNGNGYEATSAGVGLETIVSDAIGGEQFFALQTGGSQAPVAKAFLQSTFAAPFDLLGGDTLAVVVGGTTYQHTFATTDFLSPGGATAFEVTASINADTNLGFEATTAGGGIYVVIRAKAETFDSIQTTVPTITEGRNAATLLGFPTNLVETLRLYKNNIPLSKDGSPASVFSQAQQFWSGTIQNGDTLVLSVDGTAPITYTILNSDFIETGLYTSVAAANSLASWEQVLNNKLTGVTVTVIGQQLEITSNLGESNRAQVVIDPSSTLASKGMFSSVVGLSSQGAVSDFTLDRNTAQFELAVPLKSGDNLSAGDIQLEGTIKSAAITSSSVNFLSDAHVWILIDNPGTIIPTGVIPNTNLAVSTPSTNVVRYTSVVPSAFSNVLPGDYVIVWSAELPSPADQIEGRVAAVTNTTLDVLVTAAEYAAVVPTAGIVFLNGFVVLRSTKAPQKFRVQTGNKSLNQIAAELQLQTPSLHFGVLTETFLTVNTVTMNTSGSVMIVTADGQGQLMNWPLNTFSQSETPLIAYADTSDSQAQLPLFIHAPFGTPESYANPIDTYIESFTSSISLAGREPNELIAILHPYARNNTSTTTGNISIASNQLSALASVSGLSIGYLIFGVGIPLGTTVISISGSTVTMSNNATANTTGVTVYFNNPSRDAQPYGENVQEAYISGTTIGVAFPDSISGSSLNVTKDIRRLRNVDRFYIASPLNFGYNDTIVVVLNNDPDGETFTIPMYRKALVNTTYVSNALSFNAYDVDSGPTASFSQFFPGFDFSNFKVLMQAKKVLKPTPSQTAILYRSTPWGSSGEQVTVAYVYPSEPNTAIGSSVFVGTTVSILINLASGAAVPSSIDNSTQWNITVTPNTPSAGIDQVTYTWNGVGTAPALSLSGGEYVNITSQTNFNPANIGVFRVSTQTGYTPTSTSFSVQRPTGVAVAQNNVSTAVNGAITFYSPTPTTAAQVQTYVNANLSQYVSATLVNDGGMSGAGVIVLSTYEDSGFTYQNVQLRDGINWIASNNVGSSPQFTLKEPLSLYTDVGYTFNNGEEIRLIPTTMDQVYRLSSILAVSGFTTIGSLNLIDRGQRLELATNLPGSSGSLQVIGGLANQYQTPILNSSESLNNVYMTSSVNSVAGQGISSDQWFRLQAANAQNKITGFSSNSSVTIFGNMPVSGQSTIQMLGKNLTQRYFGKPRHHVRSQDDIFRVEKQGALTCISWDGIGTNPQFIKSSLNFNDTGGGTLNVSLVQGTNDVKYIILTGNTNFTELSIGDFLTISGLSVPNNGTFLVTGVSQNGDVVQVTNPDAQNEFSTGTFTFTGNANGGDMFTIGATTLTAGTYAFFTGVPNGDATSVTITANNLGTVGNSVALTFDGSTTTINSAISTWNTANPSNQVTLASGNGAQIPAGTAAAFFTGTITGTSTSVTITATNPGTVGNSVTLSFNGVDSINTAITNWNISNPSNPISLTAGDGTQIPTVGATASLSGGAGYTISLTGGVNGNFAIGSSSTITATNLAAAISLLPQLSAVAASNVVTVSATFSSAVVALAYTSISTTEVTVSGSFLTGPAFTAGQFTASSGVSEGDTVVFTAPFSSLNQGTYRVIREYSNSIWIENPDVVEEEVLLPYNPVNLGFDATTSFKVDASEHSFYLNWNGIGTEPFLGNANMGDIITLGIDFNSANQGSFMVLDSGVKLNQISQATMPAGSQFAASGAGNYFEFYSANNAQQFYVWFNVNSGNTDPAPIGFTGIQVPILNSDTASGVALKAATAINGAAASYVTASNAAATLTLALTGYFAANSPVNVTIPAPFTISVTQIGRATFLEAINPSAVNQSAVLVASGIMQDHRPQMQFSEYEATVPGDKFVVTGNVLGVSNPGTYVVFQTLNPESIIVSSDLASVTNVSLNGNETSVFIQEGVPYSGYKHVFLVAAQPGTSTLNEVVFDTNAQYPKINQAAAVQMTSLGKLNFPVSLELGLDSYRYNTGLIAEANRIIYGDPRDPITYPGVGAAGADIFVREPLAYRIQVAIDVRLLTGAPFSSVAQQVRSNVSSLINSNPVGQSIDISSIVTAARAVPGVISVAISSPQYDPTHDLITLVPSQKALIIDPTTDISVDQIGS